jgi:2-C-methyl-D-erythritol 2,4-cyclodiphosphate synthase
MSPYIEDMRKNIAKTLEIEISQINIKATTEEGLGFTGSGEGISASAVALLTQAADFYENSMTVLEKCSRCNNCNK